MRSYDVVAVAHDGEMICPYCMTPEEYSVYLDEQEVDNISPVFADNIQEDDFCGRCEEPFS